ncbi:MAG TPA: PGPGW domain-containing protein [Chthoniobacterales bacterium]|nr:PGPGW domain-containing protein [Chthoniobacterales bacterium]
MKWYWKWVHRLGLANRPRVRKLIVAVIGSTVLLFGLALIVLPGPAVLVVPLGLALLATEFAWARRLIRLGGVFSGRAWRQWWRKGPASEESLGHDES